MKTKIIPVFFTVDDNYVNYLLVTLSSLVDHASEKNHYDIHILNGGLKEENYQRLGTFQKDNVSISFDDVSGILDDIKEHLPIRDYYSHTTYYRLFVSSRYPNINKALYLDCDIVINKDVAKLFAYPIGCSLVGAARDSSVTLIPEFSYYVRHYLGIHPLSYFNAGILLMNFKAMRKNHFEEKVYKLLMNHEFPVAQDQDVLNTVCKGKVFFFEPKWNKMPLGHEIKNPCIIHYNLIYKPWKFENIMYEGYFWKYAKAENLDQTFIQERSFITKEDRAQIAKGMKKLRTLCIEEGNKAIQNNLFSDDYEGDFIYANN